MKTNLGTPMGTKDALPPCRQCNGAKVIEVKLAGKVVKATCPACNGSGKSVILTK